MGESDEGSGEVVTIDAVDLKAVYDTIDDIPESVNDIRSLFTERDGKFELRMPGIRTQNDVDRQQGALEKERIAHKATKAKLEPWGELVHDEVVTALDRIPELEAAAGDKLDDEAIEKIVGKRVEGRLRSSVAPLERDLKKARTELEELTLANSGFRAESLMRSREDIVRPLLLKAKVLPEYHEDVLLYAERHLEKSDEGGGFFAREGVAGVTSGNSPTDWLNEMIERRPGWIPPSKGGGARGSGGGGGFTGANPFSHANWNMTAQGALVSEKGMEYAERLAAAAGTTVGGAKPAAKK